MNSAKKRKGSRVEEQFLLTLVELMDKDNTFHKEVIQISINDFFKENL